MRENFKSLARRSFAHPSVLSSALKSLAKVSLFFSLPVCLSALQSRFNLSLTQVQTFVLGGKLVVI